MVVIRQRNKIVRGLTKGVLLFLLAGISLQGCETSGSSESGEEGNVISKEDNTQGPGENVITIIDDSPEVLVDIYKSDGDVNAPGVADAPSGSSEGLSALSDLYEGSGNDEETLETASEAGNDISLPVYEDRAEIPFNMSWEYAGYSKINSGCAVFYKASDNRKNIIVGVNAGHGTKGGTSVKTYCHPDKSPKVTGGTTAAGSVEAVAVSSGMAFKDGASEASVNLKQARLLRDELLKRGYDVLMLRDGDDVQLDNVARTVMCNNNADCHIAIHWDGDNLDYDKGCFYISVPEGIKNMEPVSSHWQEHDRLGDALVNGLKGNGFKLHNGGSMSIDLTQTSYSTVPSVDIELGNGAGDHSDGYLGRLAVGMADGVDSFFSY